MEEVTRNLRQALSSLLDACNEALEEERDQVRKGNLEIEESLIPDIEAVEKYFDDNADLLGDVEITMEFEDLGVEAKNIKVKIF